MTRIAVLLLVLVAAGAPGCLGQSGDPTITIDPVMARGPAAAPVTIVEFSDYQ